MFDLIVRQCRLKDSKEEQDIACKDGRIIEVAPSLDATAVKEISANGCLVTPPFIDSHFHMDATLTYGRPRVNQSGTLLEGIALWGELKPHLNFADIQRRARLLCRWAVAKGNLAIRTHVDICEPTLLAVQALLEVREEMRPYLDIQLVAFPQDGYYRYPQAEALLTKALDLGVDVVGGIPHFERTMAEGTQSVKALCEIAAERGLLVDMHCDETDDPHSRHIETLAFETQRLGMQGRVCGSHLTSMHSMDDYYAGKLMALIEESEVSAVANPLINITIQGRMETYPKRRGLTRVKEMLEQGINVAFGHDCVLDPWYSFGSHDMLEVAHMGLHVGQMTGIDEARSMFDAVTVNAARALQLEDYGLAPGCNADMVILQAADPIEAIRIRANRLFVIRRGEVVASTPEVSSEVRIMGGQSTVAFRNSEFNSDST
ncbi:MAG: amidohydrolase family protein [Arenicellales bacterium]|jgi:cytosine deaminase|nr:amidohydrolase family protein [Arenicellales bacterium]|tara:strand:+ start:411 stop:1706 length:1296 start_codon:yes stop_codon:yes gene_type:complete